MPDIESHEYSVETRPIGAEDMLLDTHGNGVKSSYRDFTGAEHPLTPISSSNIPLPADIREKIPGSSNVSDAFRGILSKLDEEEEEVIETGVLGEDKMVVFSESLSNAEKQTLIAQQYRNLGGNTLTFQFQEAFDIEVSEAFLFSGFNNGVLVIDLNSITVSDSIDAGHLFHFKDCTCKVEIKNGTIKHMLSAYGIKAENCPALYMNALAFFSSGEENRYALHGIAINGIALNCTYSDDKEALIGDIGVDVSRKYTNAKMSDSITEHNASSAAHSVRFNAHDTSATAHQALFTAQQAALTGHAGSADAHADLFAQKASVSHTHENIVQDAEEAIATAVANHDSDDDAHADLFNALESSIGSASMPPGMILPHGGSSAPSGFLMCNGATVSRTTYSNLFNVIGERFGMGDGSTTFQLPDLRGKFIRGFGGNSGAIGATQAEGLPNITGTIGLISGKNPVADGAFSLSSNKYAGIGSGSEIDDYRATFDASQSNSIYGASSHVTPVNMALNFIIKY